MKLSYLLVLICLCLSSEIRLERKNFLLFFGGGTKTFSQGLTELGKSTWKFVVNMKDTKIALNTLALENLKHLELDIKEQAKNVCKAGFTSLIANSASVFELEIFTLRVEATLEREAGICSTGSNLRRPGVGMHRSSQRFGMQPKRISVSKGDTWEFPSKVESKSKKSQRFGIQLKRINVSKGDTWEFPSNGDSELEKIQRIEDLINHKTRNSSQGLDDKRFIVANEDSLNNQIRKIKQNTTKEPPIDCSVYSNLLINIKKLQEEGEAIIKKSKTRDTSICNKINLEGIKAETEQISNDLEEYKTVLKRTNELGLDLLKSTQNIKLIENAQKMVNSASVQELHSIKLINTQIQESFSISNKVLVKMAFLVSTSLVNFGSIILDALMKAIYFYKDYKNKGLTKKEAMKRLKGILADLLIKTGIQAAKLFLKAIPPLQYVVSGISFVINWHINRNKMLNLAAKHNSSFAENSISVFVQLTALNNELRYLELDSYSLIYETIKIYESANPFGILPEAEIENKAKLMSVCRKNPFSCLKRGFSKDVKEYLLEQKICPTDIKRVRNQKEIDILKSIGYIPILQNSDSSRIMLGFKEEGNSVLRYKVPQKIFFFQEEEYLRSHKQHTSHSLADGKEKLMEYLASKSSEPAINCKSLARILKYDTRRVMIYQAVGSQAQNKVINYLKEEYLVPSCIDAITYRPKTAHLSVENLVKSLHRKMKKSIQGSSWTIADEQLTCPLEFRNQTVQVSEHSRLFVRDIYTLISRSDAFSESIEIRFGQKNFPIMHLKTDDFDTLYSYRAPFPLINAVGGESCTNFSFREDSFPKVIKNVDEMNNCKGEINCIMLNYWSFGPSHERDLYYHHTDLFRKRPIFKKDRYEFKTSKHSGCKYSFTNKYFLLKKDYTDLNDIIFDLSSDIPLEIKISENKKSLGRKLMVVYHEVEANLLTNEKERIEYDELTRGRMEMYANLGFVPIKERSTGNYVVPIDTVNSFKTLKRIIYVMVMAAPKADEFDKLSQKCTEIIEK